MSDKTQLHHFHAPASDPAVQALLHLASRHEEVVAKLQAYVDSGNAFELNTPDRKIQVTYRPGTPEYAAFLNGIITALTTIGDFPVKLSDNASPEAEQVLSYYRKLVAEGKAEWAQDDPGHWDPKVRRERAKKSRGDEQ